MTTEITREKVQQFLDSNAAEAKRKEAALEAQERKLRLHINDNHATKTMTESQRAKKEQEAWEAELAMRQERRAERAQEGNECNAWYRFMLLVFAPLILAGLLVSIAGNAPISILLLVIMIAYTGLILAKSIIAFFPKPDPAAIKQFIRSLN